MYRELVHKVLVKLADTNTDHLDKWCEKHFGEQGKLWDSYYAEDSPFNYDQFYIFANHKDAMLFILTWQ